MEIKEFEEMTKEELLTELKRIRLEAYNKTMQSREEEIAKVSKELREEFYDNAKNTAIKIIEELFLMANNYSESLLFKNGVYIFNSIESLRHMKSFESVSESVVTKVLKTLLQSEVKPINLHCKDGYFYLMDLEHILEEKGIACWISKDCLCATPMEEIDRYSDDLEVDIDESSRTFRMKYQKHTL